jgi:hypothetical protein
MSSSVANQSIDSYLDAQNTQMPHNGTENGLRLAAFPTLEEGIPIDIKPAKLYVQLMRPSDADASVLNDHGLEPSRTVTVHIDLEKTVSDLLLNVWWHPVVDFTFDLRSDNIHLRLTWNSQCFRDHSQSLASYGVQTGDILCLVSPDFFTEEDSAGSFTADTICRITKIMSFPLSC